MEKQIMSVTRSYSRTIQLKQYEPVAFFASRTYSWFDKEPNEIEVGEKSADLYQSCVDEVENEINSIKPEKAHVVKEEDNLPF